MSRWIMTQEQNREMRESGYELSDRQKLDLAYYEYCVFRHRGRRPEPYEIHCVVTKRSNEAHLTHLSRRSLMDELAKGGQICGHNLIGYDVPVLNRLWGTRIPQYRVVDTLVLSRLFHPDLDGGHSLAAWGTRLGFPKGEHTDWEVFSPEMVEYCKRDVDVTERLHDALMSQMQVFGFTKHCVDLEHSVAWICKEQEDNGFEFDKDGAIKLYEELTTRMTRIENDLSTCVPTYRRGKV